MSYENVIISKIALLIFLFFATLWFGGGLARIAIGFDLFLPGTLDIKPFLTLEQINYSIRLMGVTAYYTITGYAVSLISAVTLCISLKGRIKQRGWLFMAIVLYIVFFPYELYLAWLDFQLFGRINCIDFVNLLKDDGLLVLFKQRFHPWMAAISFLSLLSYITALLYLAWQPLNMHEKAEHSE
ncbi:MAG: hypothetical protein ACO3YM_02835 [Candidatus Kapaibacteriota bacterium]